ncbi:hypothetical protein ACJJTC_015862 [Scirpophaga incertulas]
MSGDTRHANGPEQVQNGDMFNYEELRQGLLNEDGQRKDGRQLHEMRNIFVRTATASQAKGSAYVELNGTKLLCSVFEPKPINKTKFKYSLRGRLHCSVKYAPSGNPKPWMDFFPGIQEKVMSKRILRAIRPAVCRTEFPNKQVDIGIFVLEHDGACLATAINAAGIALAEAGIPMNDTFTACSMVIIDNEFYLDPTEAEEYVAIKTPDQFGINHGIITVTVLSSLEQVVGITHSGQMNGECMINAIESLQKACDKIVSEIKKALVNDVTANVEMHEQQEVQERVVGGGRANGVTN